MNPYIISNNTAPAMWFESIPIGCGRMGATVMCGISREILHLNEESIWSENTNHNTDPNIADKLAAIRDLLLASRPAEADLLAKSSLEKCFSRIRSFESAGKVLISLHENDECENYRHSLDLLQGVATVSYDKDGSHYTREYFASYPDDVLACRIASSHKPITARIEYERDRILSRACERGEMTVIAKTAFGDHRFAIRIRIVTDGALAYEDDQFVIADATHFCVYVSIRSELLAGAEYVEQTAFPQALDFNALKSRHVADFKALMKRADIELPESEHLPLLQWQFGRYLLVSSGRPGTLPANLQGVWTDGDVSAWNADYHTNINLQMNYWPAEVTNLSDCHLSLFDYMNRYLLPAGKKTAQTVYRARGCVVHHLSDIYGYTNPADGLWGLWPHGASWLALHMWEHYLFTCDKDFLHDTAYPFIREAALFFIDTLVEDSRGRLLYAPSTSPENRYLAKDADGNTHECFLAVSSSMDVQIISTLFDFFIKSSEILGIEDDTVQAARTSLSKLPPLQIGADGRLLEWLEDYPEKEPGHRHISHSFGLYPGMMINRSTPVLYQAIDKTIERRISAATVPSAIGSANNVGWSLVWQAASYARLHKGENAFAMLQAFFERCTSQHLWDLYPLGSAPVFQIDANFGYTAALSEMLIQSHEDVIALLPALPSRWDSGSFRGLCARGGYELDVHWEQYEVRAIDLRAKFAGECRIELPVSQKALSFTDENGNVYTAENQILTLNVSGAIHLTAVK
ncbi:MAG: glycoside hydrolase family 95 protein [Clostridia bacterium]|nr:glycoside hydrolase family 95 protein [Clostridia bacterium]